MIIMLRRRVRLTIVLLAAGLAFNSVTERVARCEEPTSTFSKTTHVYKRVGDLKIEADVYRHDDEAIRPVLVWLHGGALIMGHRRDVPKQLETLCRQSGLVLVSLDYRLAPETQLAEIIEDLQAGLGWIRQEGPERFHADPSRMVVAGASAGGYLALMSGIGPEPPVAIVSYWGFGDVDGEWTTTPNASYSRGKLISKEAAWAGVSGAPVTSSDKQTGVGRSTFFVYLKQTGRWVQAVSGFDPNRDREKLTPFCPIRNLTKSYPPTLFLHGSNDHDVPVEQSESMNQALKELGVGHELIRIEGGGHGLWGGDRDLIEQAFARSVAFIQEQLASTH